MTKVFKQKLIPLVVLIALMILASITTIVLAENASEPNLVINSPTDGGSLNTTTAFISFTVSDPDLLSDSSGSYYIKVNGSTVASSIQYRGYSDSCSGDYIIDGYDQATITGTAGGLLNGPQLVEVKATDRLGNAVVKNWSFNVAVKPGFSQMVPAPNSVATDNTTVSVKISSNVPLDTNSIVLTVDGTAVQSSYNGSTGIVSYHADPPLAIGSHRFGISVTDTAGISATTSWTYTYSTGPAMTFANEGTTFTMPSPNLTVAVTSSVQLANYASATVDGQPATATFTYPGGWVNSGCSSTYVVDSYNQGTIVIQTANLRDGDHTLNVTSKDQNNNTTTLQWGFKVNCKPVISSPVPGNGSATKDSSGFTVNVTDNDPINESSIVVKLDGIQVQTSFDITKGIISFKPASGLVNGNHQVNVSVADTTGNVSTYSWSFVIQNIGPQIAFSNEGSQFTSATANLSFSVSSTIKLDNKVTLNLDGQPVTPTFTYLGHWESDYCSSTYVVDDYTKGTVTFQSGILKDGVHNVALIARDTLGNATTRQGSFTINSKPQFSAATPLNNATVNTNSEFSVKVTDNDSINVNTIIVKLDNSPVSANFDPSTGLIFYQNPSGIPDGVHTVIVSAQDTTGNVSSYSWNFTIKTAGPSMTFAEAGVNFKNYNTTVTVNVYSSVKLSDSGYSMIIDGKPVSASFSYKGHFESGYCSSTWVVDDYTQGTITALNELQDGNHALSVTAKDLTGNSSTKTWSFSVSQPPVFSNMSPAGTTSAKNPTITATISDPNGPSIDKSSVKLTVDNAIVNASLTDSGGNVIVSYTPSRIADDTTHTISVSAKDTVGNGASASWSFYMVTKADMLPTAKDCGACHALNAYNKWVHTSSPDAGMIGSGGTCGHCHKSAPAKFCGYCHDGDPWGQVDGAPKDPSYDANLNCTYCHGIEENGMVQNKIIVSVPPAREISSWYKIPHHLPQLHTINKGSCNRCHSIYLTREHNRITKAGVQITCLTCHKSSNPKVQQAIAAKDLDCKACHDNWDHDLVHTGDLDNSCQSCHTGILTQEHFTNSTTMDHNYDCSTCHDNAKETVVKSIYTETLSCAGCHDKGHNLTLADAVPPDITLYKGFKWSNPLKGSIFAGEAKAPTGFNDGKVVISNRRTDVTGQQIWDYYKQTLTATYWNLKAEPLATDKSFTAEFTKGDRAVTINCYETYNGGGKEETAGFRIEVWFK